MNSCVDPLPFLQARIEPFSGRILRLITLGRFWVYFGRIIRALLGTHQFNHPHQSINYYLVVVTSIRYTQSLSVRGHGATRVRTDLEELTLLK